MTLRPAWSEAFLPGRLRLVRPLPVPGGITRSWAWGGSDGTGVRVAVVDSGVEAGHPLVGPVAQARSFRVSGSTVTDAPDADGDLVGHGTACAGVVRSIAPGVELLSAKVVGDRLTGQSRAFAAGVRWALEAGAQVVSASLSTGSAEGKLLLHDIADDLHFAGVPLVCAAGNLPGPTWPAGFASVISVAATTEGFVANPSPPVHFGAPGIDVEVAWRGGGMLRTTGNSFAAPHVAGLAALVLAKHPGLRPEELVTVLRACADNAVPQTQGGPDG